MRLPLFPLSGALFPDGRLDLRIFEPRYIDMVSRCLREGTGFGACLINEGREVGSAAQPHAVGTLAQIVDWDQGRDGLLTITIEGGARFRVLQTDVQRDQLLMGEVELLDEVPLAEVPFRHEGLALLLRELLQQLRDAIEYPEHRFEDAGWVGGRLGELLPVEAKVRQRWLETDDPVLRLDDISHCLAEMAKDA